MNKHKIVIFKFWQPTLNTDSVVCTEETNHNAKLLATETENTTSQQEERKMLQILDISKRLLKKTNESIDTLIEEPLCSLIQIHVTLF
jgi:hypothetical protein